jgi:diacylglycerol O-acyltransferase
MTVETRVPGALSSRLSAADTLLWNIERDPSLRTTIVAVTVLDRAPDWQRVHDRMLVACDVVPRLRQRVAATGLPLRSLRWQDDEDFDLDQHLRRATLPSGSQFRDVLDLAGTMASSPFDTTRPPWEFTVVEGLADGTAAVIQKVHHSFTDGVGAVGLSRLLFDEEPDPPLDVPFEPPSAKGHGHHRGLASSAVEWATALPSLAGRALTDPIGAADSVRATARSIAKLVAPARHPRSPVMHGRGLHRRLDSFDVATSDLLDAAHAAGGSLNDAFLAGIVGGMATYHERHESPVESLRVTMPINMRRPGDPAGSNRFTPARFSVPVADLDPCEQIGRIGVMTRAWRHEPALPLSDAIAGALNLLPVEASTAIFGSMLKAIDLVATNVPGLDRRAWFAGAEVLRVYPFAPPSGAALSIALLSHVDRCCIGVTTDTDAVADPDLLVGCLRAAFDRVIAIGGDRP